MFMKWRGFWCTAVSNSPFRNVYDRWLVYIYRVARVFIYQFQLAVFSDSVRACAVYSAVHRQLEDVKSVQHGTL